MAETKCISANAKKNNGAGTIAQVGNVPSTGLTSDISMSELNSVNKTKYGSTLYRAVSAASSGNLGTIKPYSAGLFATMTPRQFIVPIIQTHLAGVANTTLRSPSNQMAQRTYNKVTATNVHTVFLTGISWTRTGDGAPVYTYTTSASAPNFGADHETLDIAEFVYRTGKPLPTQADFSTQYSH